MKTNPIPKNDLWITPTFDDLQDSIAQLPVADRQIAYHYTMMVLNLCHNLVQERLEAEKELTV